MQFFLLLAGCVFFVWQTKWRPVSLLFMIGYFLVECQTLDGSFVSSFPFSGFVFSVAAVVCTSVLLKKNRYSEISFSDFFAFYGICSLILILLSVLLEIIKPEWGIDLRKNGFDIEIINQEFMEAVCFLSIFLLSSENHIVRSDILDRFCAKYGNAELEVLARKGAKIVYNAKTPNGESILTVVLNVSMVRFFKYATSQGVQQSLYEDNMEVAEIEDSYFHNGAFVYVQKKIEGTNLFPRTDENVYRIGELIGKLHSVTSVPKYKNPIMLIKHPNVFCQMFICFREYYFKKLFFFIHCIRFRNFPKGVCHRDLNRTNIVMKPDGALALIDFEVHQYQPLAEGLVRFCQRQDKETGDKILSFFRGYNTVRPLTKPEMEYLEKELSIKLEL